MARIRGLAYAILDGTLIPIDRVADQKPYYSGKHRRHGVNVQVIADAAGRLVWASAEPWPREAQRLRDLTGRPAYERREALEDLGSRLAAFAGGSRLRELAETLRPETIRSRPLDELWAYTLEVLDTVASGSSAPAEPDRSSSFRRRT